MTKAATLSKVTRVTLLGTLSIILGAEVHAKSTYGVAFSSFYPSSTSDDNAGCDLCHGGGDGLLNEYGRQLLLNGTTNFGAVAGLCSVNINGGTGSCYDGSGVISGTSNLDEITAGTQPGWTTGQNNIYLESTGASAGTRTAPFTITGDLDPPALNQPPTADPGGPYNGILNVAITFDGSGSDDPDGWLNSRQWDFGDGNIGWGVNPSHAYLAAGEYTVTLTVTDNDGETDSDTTTVTIPVWSYGGDAGSWRRRPRFPD